MLHRLFYGSEVKVHLRGKHLPQISGHGHATATQAEMDKVVTSRKKRGELAFPNSFGAHKHLSMPLQLYWAVFLFGLRIIL